MAHLYRLERMSAARSRYSQALAALDKDAILATLAEEVVIYVAVHDGPLEGKGVADFLFGVLREELEAVTITDEIAEGDRSVVLFDTTIRGMAAQGLNVVRLDEAGSVCELTVFFRPLPSLQVVADVVGARMAERFGPPPP